MLKPFSRLATTAVAVASLFMSGCGKQAVGAGSQNLAGSGRAMAVGAKVPAGFLWGVSTAGYQWEGFDTTSQWSAWDNAGKTTERNVAAANGVNDYKTDTKLAQGLGCNAFRTSFEWSRIEPTQGVIDPAGVKFYHDLIANMKANGQTPVMTLHHFSHPQWFAAQGGWESAEAPALFAKYAAFVAKEFANEVEWYITFNEPNVYIAGGWIGAAMPPGKKNPFAAYKAINQMIKGHRAAYAAIHANDATSKVSFNWYTAEWALRGLMSAEGPQATEEEAKVSSETFMSDEMASGGDAANGNGGRTIDYVSFDYYCKLSLKQLANLPRQDKWEVYPQGMYNALKRYYARYKMPILIAENGMATWDGAPRADRWTRAAYTVAHVKEMQRAMAEGVPVLGYIQWSITDNYEWGSYSPRFGLYRVECRDKNFVRIPTDGVAAYRQVIAEGGVTQAAAAKYLIGTTGGVNLVVPGANGNTSNTGVSDKW